MSGDAPVISIVVPAHNAGRFLAATLQSIVEQTEVRWECVIVDDGSTDGTREIAQSFASTDRRFRVIHQAQRGTSAARNAGFRATRATSRYVTFMDSDDVWLREALATLMKRAEGSPEAVGSHGLAERIDAAGEPIGVGEYAQRGRTRWGRQGSRLVVWPLDRATDFDVLINGNVLFPPGLLLARRSAYEAVGPFDESLAGPEDWDMLIRLSRLGDIEFVDEVILHYRQHDQNLGAQATVREQAWHVRCMAFYSHENTGPQRRAARKGWRAYQRHLIAESRAVAYRKARQGDVAGAVEEALRVGVRIVRYVRGFPLPRVRAPSLKW